MLRPARTAPWWRLLHNTVKVKSGRYRALSLTALEEAVMWNVKELTS